MAQQFILALTPTCCIYRCGCCGDLHIDIQTVSLRVAPAAMKDLCLIVEHLRDSPTEAGMSRPYRLAIPHSPVHVILNQSELLDLHQACTSAVRLVCLTCPHALAHRRN